MMGKFLYNLPRGLAILFIAFLSIFALDVFEAGAKWYEILGGLFIHLIPNFALILVLIVAWKKPILGGLIFLVLGFFMAVFFNFLKHPLESMPVILPVFIIGILFLIQKRFLLRRETSVSKV